MGNDLIDGALDEMYRKHPEQLTDKARDEAAARAANRARPMLAAKMVTMFLGTVAIVVIGLVLGVLILFGAL